MSELGALLASERSVPFDRMDELLLSVHAVDEELPVDGSLCTTVSGHIPSVTPL